MHPQIQSLAVQIVRFVGDDQPGWVECEFKDAEGRRHTLIDKVPIFTGEDLPAGSSYPKPGTLPCETLAHWRDATGRELARISTANPLDDKSAKGLSEFIVLSTQLTDVGDAMTAK
jgi:hypothetical protein